MKEAKKIIEDTIRIIDDYEAEIDKINQRSKRTNRVIVVTATAVILSVILFLILNY